MTAHKLIAIPVGEVFKPTINPTASVVIQRPKSDLNGLCDDDFFHGRLPLFDGERSQKYITLHFPGEDSTIWPPARTLVSDGAHDPLLIALRSGHAPGYSLF